MPDARYDRARARIRRLLPPPPPNSGWLYAFQRIVAYFIGDLADDRAGVAEQQLLLGAHLNRTGTNAADWAIPESQWTWASASETGAEELWLDHWGATFNVPRIPGEQDPAYSLRILAEVTRPGTVNLGMAQTIDEAAGITGTVVIESRDYYSTTHFNEGHHCGEGIHANNAYDMQGEDTWATFIVLVKAPLTQRVNDIVAFIADRKKAAGTRRHRTFILVPNQSHYVSPTYLDPNYVA